MNTRRSVDAASIGLQSAAGVVPLLGVEIDAILDGPCLQVCVRQRYRNAEPGPIEVVYVFPLPEDAAVCGFRARFGAEQVEGRVQARDKAFATYDDALIDGRMAALLDQERPNVFTASLGNLPAGEEAVLEIRYVARLRPEGDAYRLTFPTTVSPRYVPARPAEVGQPDGERVNPERWLAVPYGLRVTLHVGACGQGGLRSVASPSHPVRVTLGDDGAEVTLAQDDVALDRDLVVLVQPKATALPSALAVPSPGGGETVLLEFLPDLPRAEREPCEVVFLLDCSGSMAGDSIAAAKRALQLCVRALDIGDTFDIVRFGSTHEGLWRSPIPFDDASLAKASAWLEATDADLGGTEILAPLQHILGRPLAPGRARSVVLLTDGQVSNEAEVIELAARHANTTTIFAFGIGAGASDHLLRGVARAGRGEAEMIFPGERIEPKVLRTFARVRSPRFADVRLDTGDAGAQLAPRELPPLFAGSSFSVLARFPAHAPATLVLAAGAHRWEVPVQRAAALPADRDAIAPIALCWARERIRDLEAPARSGSRQQRSSLEMNVPTELVALGEAYGLLSRETSYVAVSSRVVAAGQDAELRQVPVVLTAGWGGASAMPMLVAASLSMPRMSSLSQKSIKAIHPQILDGDFDAEFARVVRDNSTDARASLQSLRVFAEEAAGPEYGLIDRMHQLLRTQRADGLFAMSPELEQELQDATDLLEPWKHDSHVITVVVVELLRSRFTAFADESRLAMEKALLALGATNEAAARSRCAALLSAL